MGSSGQVTNVVSLRSVVCSYPLQAARREHEILEYYSISKSRQPKNKRLISKIIDTHDRR